jgi:hypothetical protein
VELGDAEVAGERAGSGGRIEVGVLLSALQHDDGVKLVPSILSAAD